MKVSLSFFIIMNYIIYIHSSSKHSFEKASGERRYFTTYNLPYNLLQFRNFLEKIRGFK